MTRQYYRQTDITSKCIILFLYSRMKLLSPADCTSKVKEYIRCATPFNFWSYILLLGFGIAAFFSPVVRAVAKNFPMVFIICILLGSFYQIIYNKITELLPNSPQLELMLILALFLANPATHPPRTHLNQQFLNKLELSCAKLRIVELKIEDNIKIWVV